jgi:hypothetical protein
MFSVITDSLYQLVVFKFTTGPFKCLTRTDQPFEPTLKILSELKSLFGIESQLVFEVKGQSLWHIFTRVASRRKVAWCGT